MIESVSVCVGRQLYMLWNVDGLFDAVFWTDSFFYLKRTLLTLTLSDNVTITAEFTERSSLLE